MARFRFKYEAVLRKRRSEEQACQRELAIVEGQRVELETALRGVRDTLLGGREDLRARIGGGLIDSTAIRQQAATAQRQRVNAERLAVELAGVLSRVKTARERLVQASSARRSMELLRERRHEEFVAEINRKEAAELDDVANARAFRLLRSER